MKNAFHLPGTLKALTLALLLLSVAESLRSQSFVDPIGASIYGQPIVTCTGPESGYESVATGGAVYARHANKIEYYTKVWTAPGALHITSFSIYPKNGAIYRAILLHDGEDNFYVVYNKVKAPLSDSTITGPVLLPAPYSGKYRKIVAGSSLHVYSFLAGGPPGNVTVSHDRGQTWLPDTINLGYNAVYDICVDKADTAYVIGTGGIYRQLPNDSIWVQFNNNAQGANKIFVDRQHRIITGGYPSSVYLSTDGGTSFNPDNTGLSGQIKFFADDAYGNLYAYTGTLYRNLGGTGTWTSMQAGLTLVMGSNINIAAISGDSLLTIGTGNLGMYTSNNQGNTWTATNDGIHAEDIYSLITQPDGRLLCSTDLGIFYKDATDTLWHPTNPITTFYPGSYINNDHAGTIFVAVGPTFGSPYPLGKSTDNGLNFVVDSNGFSTIGGSAFYIDETGARYFYNYYGTSTNPLTIWKSPFGSSTWSLDTAGLPVFPIYGTGVKAMCSDKKGYLYACIDLPGGVYLYRRPITGTTWAIDNTGLGTNLIISPMASDPSLGIVVAKGSDLFHRTANGWVQLQSLPGNVNALSVDHNGTLYAAAANYNYPDSNEVFISKDTGATWQSAGLLGFVINNLVSTGDTTYALTFGNWGYMLAGHSSVGIPQISKTKANVTVFPNPSISGEWTVQTGDEWKNSRLEIYNVDGKIIYRGFVSHGSTQINAPALSSGVYLLRIFNTSGSVNGWLVKQ